jgi:WD40 repeat protein
LPKRRLGGLCQRCVSRQLFSTEGAVDEPAPEAGIPELADGLKLDRYQLEGKIGEGGFGVVYSAEQVEPVRRRVAIKIIKLGMDTRSVVARFEAERQAVALMDHPNIARVFDAGATGTGRPYFVMELVSGPRFTDYCDRHHLSIRRRLELFIQVCRAVQHAHQKGVIHRDLKPSNILVPEQDGVPVPKIIDFGIAKAVEQPLTDKTLVTRFDHFIGTPSYMSPEQAELGGLDIDTRSDIYSLGVLLYELLTGRTPFDTQTLLRSGLDSALKVIREVEPPRPSTQLRALDDGVLDTVALARASNPARLRSELGGDLDWIVMKCLEKDRSRRYETANALAQDLHRHLANEPVTAAAPSAAYRFGKFVRRNKAAFALASGAALVLMVATGVSVRQAVRATRAEESLEKQVVAVRAERDAKEQARQAVVAEQRMTRRMNYAADTYLAQRALEAGNFGRARLSLEEHRPRAGEEDLRGFEWRYLWQRSRGDQSRVLRGHSNLVAAIAFSPDGSTLASASSDNTVRIWKVASGELVKVLPLAGQPQAVGWSPDGKTLAAGSYTGPAQLWDAETFTPGTMIRFSPARVAFSPAGGVLAVAAGGSPWGYNLPSHVHLFSGAGKEHLATLTNAGGRVAFSPDGRILASGSFNNEIKLWHMPEARPAGVLADTRRTMSISISAHGQLATCDYSPPSIRVWDLATREVVATLPGHEVRTLCVAFSPDGEMLASGGTDQKIRLWHVGATNQVAVLEGHGEAITSLAFSPDGRVLASASKDDTVMLWPTRRETQAAILTNAFIIQGPGNPVLSRDGSLFAAAMRDRRLVIAATGALEPRTIVNSEQFPIAFSADGATLLAFNYPSTLNQWDVAAGTNRMRIKMNVNINRESEIALSPDARRLAVGGAENVVVFDLLQRRVVGTVGGHQGLILCNKYSPDGTLLATTGQDGVAKLWDAATFKQVAVLRGHKDQIRSMIFSPDGRTLVTGSHDDTIRLWAVPTGEWLATLAGHRDTASALAITPDGRTLASSGPDLTVRLWNLETRREVTSLPHPTPIVHLMFLPDAGALLLGDRDARAVQFLRAPSMAEIDAAKNFQP